MLANYFFIDGSALTAQIRRLRRADRTFTDRKLCPLRLVTHFSQTLRDLGAIEFKRATFYFPRGDEVAVNEYLTMPDRKKPGTVRDVHFKFCGEKLKGSAEFNKFVDDNVPDKWKNRFTKSEKGVDIEICCDALKLASASKLERLFFLTNDDDFAPLCRALKEFGANVSLIHLTEVVPPNESLLEETDTYDVIDLPRLQEMFFPLQEPTLPFEEAAKVVEPHESQVESKDEQPVIPAIPEETVTKDEPNKTPKEQRPAIAGEDIAGEGSGGGVG